MNTVGFGITVKFGNDIESKSAVMKIVDELAYSINDAINDVAATHDLDLKKVHMQCVIGDGLDEPVEVEVECCPLDVACEDCEDYDECPYEFDDEEDEIVEDDEVFICPDCAKNIELGEQFNPKMFEELSVKELFDMLTPEAQKNSIKELFTLISTDALLKEVRDRVSDCIEKSE